MDYIKRLRDLREDHDKTQQQIADVLGTSQTMYAVMSGAPTSCPSAIC
jgi:transcriptional regulator with XRE-family HTH domain